jgi:NitT/TauT family transport system permease protein
MASLAPTRWDIGAALLVLALLAIMAQAGRGTFAPLESITQVPLSLDPWRLPYYAARTALRMMVALGCSTLFTFLYAPLAAKYRGAGALLVPLLDILQSVPVLGFISITITFFLDLIPGRVLGAELAAIFAIFTSQAWNMAFSLYQSLHTVPAELVEASLSFRLSGWMRFWRLEVPFALPSLVWNMMVSVAGGWFFVVASEAVTVGHTRFALPGIGSYIATAIAVNDGRALIWAILAMLVLILLIDQLLFRPLLAWSERFRIDAEPGEPGYSSFVLTLIRRSRIGTFLAPLAELWDRIGRHPAAAIVTHKETASPRMQAVPVLLLLGAGLVLGHYLITLPRGEILATLVDGLITLARVFALVALASVIWVPVGVWIGLRPRFGRIFQPLVQLLAAFPANLLYPLLIVPILVHRLDANIWLSPLMILGAQWYLLFNIIVGTQALPHELRQIATNLHVTGWLWWRRVGLPAIFPYFLTGAITASGGAWNAAIVAEYVSWGDRVLVARGLGATIAEAARTGDSTRLALGIGVMCLLVIVVNRLVWRPLYAYAERKFR